MPSTETPWQPPRWESRYKKHHPLFHEDWKITVQNTRGRDGNARYSPHLSLEDIERIEMETVDPRLCLGREILPPPKRCEKVYWRRLPFVVGASKGETTNFIYVIHHQSGSVHGYPITERELRAAGARP